MLRGGKRKARLSLALTSRFLWKQLPAQLFSRGNEAPRWPPAALQPLADLLHRSRTAPALPPATLPRCSRTVSAPGILRFVPAAPRLCWKLRRFAAARPAPLCGADLAAATHLWPTRPHSKNFIVVFLQPTFMSKQRRADRCIASWQDFHPGYNIWVTACTGVTQLLSVFPLKLNSKYQSLQLWCRLQVFHRESSWQASLSHEVRVCFCELFVLRWKNR